MDRLEEALRATAAGSTNSLASEDLQKAKAMADYLDRHQFGHGWREQMTLRPRYSLARFHQWRRSWTN
jgi:hypothetical protein